MRPARFISILLGLLTACGYTLNQVPDRAEAPTISIPYVEGDIDGRFTSALIREVSASGNYVYRRSGGEWILQVRIINDSYENIGFRYDRSRKDRVKHWIIPVELREGLLIEVQLISGYTQEVVKGPNRIAAQIEYDHDYYTIRDGVNIFSLGQLTDIDSAEDAAKTPLFERAAEKVVNWLIYSF